MKENTVYLLYNTNARDVKLHHGLLTNFNREIGNREWEYEDKDEFTIMYSADDERKYTDIKILSKTKLKERPKSADQLIKKRKVSVEGILIRRSNSLSIIEEDLLVLRRCPLIKPLLSETEILQLQLLLQECRRKQAIDKIESETSNGLHKLLPEHKNLRLNSGDIKDAHLNESAKEKSSRRTPSASPLESDANKIREEAKTKIDNSGRSKSLDKWKKTPIVNPTNLKKSENKNNVTNFFHGEKPKKQDFLTKKSKSEDKAENGKRKSEQIKTVGGDKEITKQHRSRTSETQSQQKIKSLKNKSKIRNADKHKEKKQKKSKKDSSNTEAGSDTKSKSKEHLSNQDQFSHSSEKTQVSIQKEKKKSRDNIKSKGTKTKKNKISERIPSTSIFEKKTDKSEKNKPVIYSDKLSKVEKRPKSSTSLSIHQNSKKVKTGLTKNKTPYEADLAEDLLQKKETGKSISSDKSTAKNKTEKLETEKTSSKKNKIKDKMLTGTIQYMIHYVLSNPIFINFGWTLQPTEKALSRIVTFKAEPANPQTYCFRRRDNIEQKFYPSGALALKLAQDGTGRINYSNGAPAIIIAKSHAGMKLTIYSCPTKDPLVKDSFFTKIIGMFDSFGNGVVYDSNFKTILNFNQMEGIYNSPTKQTPYKWRWSCFKVLEARRLKELLNTMVNEFKQSVSAMKSGKTTKALSSGSSRKSETSLEKKPVDNLYEALMEELPNPVMPKPKIKMKTHDNAFKSIVLKINKEITLRINGQDNVAVNFSAKSLFYKMDLGVRIDPESVERIDEVTDERVESVQSVLGDVLHPSPSLQKLHKLLDINTLS